MHSQRSSVTAMTKHEPMDDPVEEKTETGPADTKTRPDASTSAPPDGGLRAWCVVFGAWCSSFCTFGWLNSIGVFQQYYETHLLTKLSASTIAWIPSLQIFFMLATGPLVGILYDRFGPRYLILVGTFLHVLGLMMASISHTYPQLLLSQGICSAIGVAAIFQPSLNSISGWFSTKRATAFGLLTTGSSLGGVIFPIMTERLTERLGFGWAMRISALLILALLVVANLTIRPYRLPVYRPVSLRDFTGPLREPNFVLLSIGLLLFTFGFWIPIDYVGLEAAAAGMRPGLVQYLLPILNAGSLVGRAAAGFAADRFGRYNVFIIVCLLASFMVLCLWIPAANDAARIAFAAFYGCFSGIFIALVVALILQISPPEEIGVRTGIAFCIISIAGLTTNPISGAILAHSGWLGPKIFTGCLCLAGCFFVIVARIRAAGWKLSIVF